MDGGRTASWRDHLDRTSRPARPFRPLALPPAGSGLGFRPSLRARVVAMLFAAHVLIVLGASPLLVVNARDVIRSETEAGLALMQSYGLSTAATALKAKLGARGHPDLIRIAIEGRSGA